MNPRHQQEPRRVDQPEAGYFRVRLVRGGPWVAAKIEQDAEGRWAASIDGQLQDPTNLDPALAKGVFQIWHYGTRIPEPEYEWMLAVASHARIHKPDAPEANPTRRINIAHEPPPF